MGGLKPRAESALLKWRFAMEGTACAQSVGSVPALTTAKATV